MPVQSSKSATGSTAKKTLPKLPTPIAKTSKLPQFIPPKPLASNVKFPHPPADNATGEKAYAAFLKNYRSACKVHRKLMEASVKEVLILKDKYTAFFETPEARAQTAALDDETLIDMPAPAEGVIGQQWPSGPALFDYLYPEDVIEEDSEDEEDEEDEKSDTSSALMPVYGETVRQYQKRNEEYLEEKRREAAGKQGAE